MRSIAAIAGLILLAGGFGWIWPPLALIVFGAALLGGAVWGHVRTPVIRREATGATEATPNASADAGHSE